MIDNKGSSKGFGFVTFANADDALAAVMAKDKKIGNRVTRCNYAWRGNPRKQQSNENNDNNESDPNNPNNSSNTKDGSTNNTKDGNNNSNTSNGSKNDSKNGSNNNNNNKNSKDGNELKSRGSNSQKSRQNRWQKSENNNNNANGKATPRDGSKSDKNNKNGLDGNNKKEGSEGSNSNGGSKGGSEEKLLKKNETNRRLFIHNLQWKTEDRALRNAFKKYGELEEAVGIKDRKTQHSKGYAFVTFKDPKSLSALVRVISVTGLVCFFFILCFVHFAYGGKSTTDMSKGN